MATTKNTKKSTETKANKKDATQNVDKNLGKIAKNSQDTQTAREAEILSQKVAEEIANNDSETDGTKAEKQAEAVNENLNQQEATTKAEWEKNASLKRGAETAKENGKDKTVKDVAETISKHIDAENTNSFEGRFRSKANELFKRYPERVEPFYFTSDGTAFFTPYDANNHAMTLKDKAVTKVSK